MSKQRSIRLPKMTDAGSITELLLTAKLYRPRFPEKLVQRQRLLDKLNDSYRENLTLVSAPAGYGKTTLVNLWLETTAEPYAWLSLDERDNNLQIFVSYLAAAVRARYSAALPHIWSIVNSYPLPKPERLADLFLQEVERLSGPLLLVLDDYHAITDLASNRFMSRLISWPRANLRLVLIVRSDPPLPLARMRARRHLTEIRSADLSFTQPEAANLMEQLLDVPADREITTLLLERTEGWPAGLHLAAVSLRESDDALTFASRFASSTHRLVSDYLVDEVLSSVTEEQRLELLRTSLLDEFCAPLCEVIAGPTAENGFGQRFIESLWRANLFVVALDDEGVWYRYHHLLRDLLRKRLRQTFPEKTIADLHARAGAWYAAAEMIGPAIAHFVAGGDLPMAVQLLEKSFLHVLNHDDWRRLERWLSQLPPEALEFPSVQVLRAYVYHFRFQLEEVLRLVDAAEEGFQRAPYDMGEQRWLIYLGIINCLRTIALDVLGYPERSLFHAQEALQQLPQFLIAPYSLAEFHYYDALRRLGEGKHALELAQQHLQNRPLDKPDARTLRLLMAVGNYYHAQADIANSLTTAKTLRDLAQRANNAIAFGWGLYGIGWAHYEMNELEAAEHVLKQVLQQRFQVHVRVVLECSAGLTYTYLAQGNRQAAAEVAQQLREFLLDRGLGGQLVIADVLGLHVSLVNTIVPSRSTVDALKDQLSQMVISDLWFAPQLTAVRAYLRLGQPHDLQDALDLLRAYRTKVESIYNTRKLIQIAAFETLVHSALGDQEAALASLQEAVLLGEQGGAQRAIVDAGPGLVPYLHQLHTLNVAPDYVARLLAQIARTETITAPEPAAAEQTALPLLLGYDTALKASLTNRELDVLSLIAQRLTNKEIAVELSVSPHTVKRHSLNLYRKLGVKNRRQAVARAEALGLLSS